MRFYTAVLSTLFCTNAETILCSVERSTRNSLLPTIIPELSLCAIVLKFQSIKYADSTATTVGPSSMEASSALVKHGNWHAKMTRIEILMELLNESMHFICLVRSVF